MGQLKKDWIVEWEIIKQAHREIIQNIQSWKEVKKRKWYKHALAIPLTILVNTLGIYNISPFSYITNLHWYYELPVQMFIGFFISYVVEAVEKVIIRQNNPKAKVGFVIEDWKDMYFTMWCFWLTSIVCIFWSFGWFIAFGLIVWVGAFCLIFKK